MKINTYLLTICLILIACNLHALNIDRLIPDRINTLESLREELTGLKDLRALLVELSNYSPEEKSEFIANLEIDEEEFNRQLSLLPGTETEIDRLEIKIAILNNNLFMKAQGA